LGSTTNVSAGYVISETVVIYLVLLLAWE